MMAADVFVLPSYREGFGSVIIEAAACGLPAVASRIYGLTDAVEEGVTGMMHPSGDASVLCNCMQRLCDDSDLRVRMGNAARIRAQEKFSMHVVTAALVDYYDKQLKLR
jgi:glycosyltransferase involved in cell wall biosynthesis